MLSTNPDNFDEISLAAADAFVLRSAKFALAESMACWAEVAAAEISLAKLVFSGPAMFFIAFFILFTICSGGLSGLFAEEGGVEGYPATLGKRLAG